jgi:plastocyanin
MQRRSAPTLAALAVTALPLPLHIVGSGRPGSATPAAASHAVTTAGSTSQPAAQPSAGSPTDTHSSPSPPTPSHAASPPHPIHRSHRSAGRGKRGRTGANDLVLRVHSSVAHHKAKAHAAGDPGDTISDFKFSPATITIHVGDTITWTNNGPTSHTATASNGSFDTGTMKKGASASHTFTQAGTFPYICSIHPFMHGTVVVVASSTTPSTSAGTTNSGTSGGSGSSGTSGSSGSSGSTGSTGTGSGQGTSSGTTSTLPVTGLDLIGTLFAGTVLIGAGIGLRRRFRGAEAKLSDRS